MKMREKIPVLTRILREIRFQHSPLLHVTPKRTLCVLSFKFCADKKYCFCLDRLYVNNAVRVNLNILIQVVVNIEMGSHFLISLVPNGQNTWYIIYFQLFEASLQLFRIRFKMLSKNWRVVNLAQNQNGNISAFFCGINCKSLLGKKGLFSLMHVFGTY